MSSIPSFPAFYAAVRKRRPFPWQESLANRVANGRGMWPRLINLPTGAGKTAIIDIAVYALAAQSDLPGNDRTARIRTLFVVDRRIVVDDVAKYAVDLAKALRDAEPGTPLEAVSRRLLTYGGEVPLQVSVLRGAMYRDDAWIRLPSQPAIAVSTVDQIGSRMLFRGYSLSDEQRPVHAGLAAVDSLLVVDEAHISRPFLQTIRAARREMAQGEIAISRPLEIVEMTATTDVIDDVLRITAGDREDATLAKRLSVAKPCQLLESPHVEEDSAEAARELAKRGAKVIAVILNRVDSARETFERLCAAEREGQTADQANCPENVVLFTGRNRPFERDRLWGQYGRYCCAADPADREKPLFVVATQAIEVGADLDFDAMVSESAPIDALRQRFGRMNRLGNKLDASGVVIHRRQRTSDPVYGEPLAATWAFLVRKSYNAKKKMYVDFGIDQIDALLLEEELGNLVANRPDAPPLFAAHLRAWAQTNPEPRPDPAVAPFLHGVEALEPADVQIVWRAELETLRPDAWTEVVSVAPPVVSESLAVPIYAVRRWLAGLSPLIVTDVEGVMQDDPNAKQEPAPKGPFLIWRGPDNSTISATPASLRPGMTIVVPANYGGCDKFGWNPRSSQPVDDLGNEANLVLAKQGLKPFRYRFFPGESLRQELVSGSETVARNYRETLAKWADSSSEERRELASAFREALRKARKGDFEVPETSKLRSDGAGNVYLEWSSRSYRDKRGLICVTESSDQITDSGDESSTSDEAETKAKPVSLVAHLDAVGGLAKLFGEQCGLSPELTSDLVLAAKLHDIGKANLAFQLCLCGGDYSVMVRQQNLLAKSLGVLQTPAERRRVLTLSGFPRGGRHEFTSVALLPKSQLAAANDHELVKYLVGTHHGYGRPYVPAVEETEPPEISPELGIDSDLSSIHGGLEKLDSGWTRLFWRMQARYGYWGIAFLEAILRCADCTQSARERECAE